VLLTCDIARQGSVALGRRRLTHSLYLFGCDCCELTSTV